MVNSVRQNLLKELFGFFAACVGLVELHSICVCMWLLIRMNKALVAFNFNLVVAKFKLNISSLDCVWSVVEYLALSCSLRIPLWNYRLYLHFVQFKLAVYFVLGIPRGSNALNPARHPLHLVPFVLLGFLIVRGLLLILLNIKYFYQVSLQPLRLVFFVEFGIYAQPLFKHQLNQGADFEFGFGFVAEQDFKLLGNLSLNILLDDLLFEIVFFNDWLHDAIRDRHKLSVVGFFSAHFFFHVQIYLHFIPLLSGRTNYAVVYFVLYCLGFARARPFRRCLLSLCRLVWTFNLRHVQNTVCWLLIIDLSQDVAVLLALF